MKTCHLLFIKGLLDCLPFPRERMERRRQFQRDDTPLKDLSPPWHFIVESRIQRHRFILRLLLGILDAIGVIEAEYDEIHGLG